MGRPGGVAFIQRGLCPAHGLLRRRPVPLPPLHLRPPGLQLAEGGAGAVQLPEEGAFRLGRALFRVEGADLALHPLPRLSKRIQPLPLPDGEGPQALQKRRVPGQEALPLLRRDILRRLEDGEHQGRKLIVQRCAPGLQCVPRPGQQVLVPEIGGAVEEPSQNLVFLVAVGVEKFPEFPLGQHDDLAKLLGIEAQKRLDALRDPHRPLDGGLLRLTEQGVGLCVPVLVRRAAFLAEMQAALHLVFPAALEEAELHHRVGGFGHSVAVEHIRAALAAAGDAVEGEHDGVKDRGLARAGVPGHEIEALFQVFKAHRRRPGVGAEGGHLQIQRSHAFSSCSVRKSRSLSISPAAGAVRGSARRRSAPAKPSSAASRSSGAMPPERSV